jgi:hypothetical protein
MVTVGGIDVGQRSIRGNGKEVIQAAVVFQQLPAVEAGAVISRAVDRDQSGQAEGADEGKSEYDREANGVLDAAAFICMLQNYSLSRPGGPPWPGS